MRQCAADVGHVFANHLGSKTVGNVSCNDKNYYSYSTVFGQWVDENVVLIYTGDTSPSSTQHQLCSSMFPSWVHVFEYNDGGNTYYGWRGCNLVGYGSFTYERKIKLLDYFVSELYREFLLIKESNTKNCQSVNLSKWRDFERLCSLYKSISPKKWIAEKRPRKKIWTEKRIMVRELANGNEDIKSIADKMFGEGTFDRYMQRTEHFRKADAQKERTIKIARYLGLSNPYQSSWRGVCWMSPKDVRSLTAKQRLAVKFGVLYKKEQQKINSEKEDKKEKSILRFFKYLTGESVNARIYLGIPVSTCINRFTGEQYVLSENYYLYNDTILKTYVNFGRSDFDSYTTSADKRMWMEDFYRKCDMASRSCAAQRIFIVNVAKRLPTRYSWEKRYALDDDFLSKLTKEEADVCKWYFEKQEKYYADEEARRRAEEIRRKALEEEKRKEKELQEKLEKETIDQCINEGIEGIRNLWRLHYMSCESAIRAGKITSKDDFYNGGNVLMRFNMDKNIVETSMQIRIDISTCKKFFRIITNWRENPERFKPCTIGTLSGKYTIVSFDNDILVAGCHRISYAEMEHMYKEIISLEKVA